MELLVPGNITHYLPWSSLPCSTHKAIYFLSVFSNGIQKLLKENLWTTSVALNSCMIMNIDSLGSACLYNKSKNAAVIWIM